MPTPIAIKPSSHQLPSRWLGPQLACWSLITSCAATAAADLNDLSLEQLLQVPVIGASKYEQQQSEVAAAVSVITRQEIESYGWRTLDEAVASLPGMYSTYDRQYVYLGTRGFGLPGDYNTRILVTINGNRVNDPTYDTGPVGRQFPLDLDLVERIELIPGPGGAVYGQNAMFGVINIITRTGAELNGTRLKADMQNPQAQSVLHASWGGQLHNGVDLLLSVSAQHANGDDLGYDYGSAGISGLAAGLDGERDRELFVRAARGAWSFDLTHGDHRKYDPTGAYQSDPLVPGQYQGDRYTLAQLQYDGRFADDHLSLTGRVFGGMHRYSSHLSYGTLYSFPSTDNWHGVEARLLSTFAANHKLMLGLELQDNSRRDQAILDLADPANDLLIPGSGYRLGLYAQDEWRLHESLTATLGLRVDRNDSTGTAASPRAALIWQASPGTTLKTLYGNAHRAPNAFERDYDDGFAQIANPMLRGESIDTAELVADHRVNSQLALRGSIYQWKMRDLITLGLDPVQGLPQYQSGAKVEARGIELSMDNTWSSGARLRGSVAFQHATQETGVAVVNSPGTLGKLNLVWPLPVADLRVGYELRYDSARLSLDGSRLGGYTLSNLNVSARPWGGQLALMFSVYNLLDKRYQHPGADTNWQNALEQDGRSLRLSLGYSPK
jgi:iron complex outermembrane receptor protein